MTSLSTGAIFSCASFSVAALVVIRRRTLPWPASGATVGSVASRNSWTFSATADSPMPAKWRVLETMEPSLRARNRGSSVASNMLFISVGTPGSLAQGGDDPIRVVPDGGVTVDAHPEFGEALADPGRVRIHEVAQEHLGTNGHDLRALYISPITHAGILQSARWRTTRKPTLSSKEPKPWPVPGSRRGVTNTPRGWPIRPRIWRWPTISRRTGRACPPCCTTQPARWGPRSS